MLYSHCFRKYLCNHLIKKNVQCKIRNKQLNFLNSFMIYLKLDAFTMLVETYRYDSYHCEESNNNPKLLHN